MTPQLYAPCAALIAIVLAGAAGAQTPDPAGLLSGLTASWTDGERTITRVERRLEFAFGQDESPHPRLDPQHLEGRWRGQLQPLQAGRYQFAAEVRGRFVLKLAGQTVLEMESHDGEPTRKASAVIELPAGPTPLEATFVNRNTSTPSLRVVWRREGGPGEPLPATALHRAPAQQAKALASSAVLERGRAVLLEHRCVRCHDPEGFADLASETRPAASLDRIGSWIYSDWIYHWLRHPHAVRPGSAMPRVFGGGVSEHVDLYAVTQLLTHEGESLIQPDEPPAAAQVAVGKSLFLSTGCIACHRAPGENSPASVHLRSLNSLGSKTSPEVLARFLDDPAAHHPGALMPRIVLAEKHADSLDAMAAYLAAGRNPRNEVSPVPPTIDQLANRHQALVKDEARRKAFAAESEINRWKALGRVVVRQRGCVNCHALDELKPNIPVAPPLAELVTKARTSAPPAGCLATDHPRWRPRLSLGQADRQAVAAFLAQGAEPARSAAPEYDARLRIARLGCLNCHTRDGQGGRYAVRLAALAKLKDMTNRPPDLTDIGRRLTYDQLREVLLGDRRTRTELSVKMPHYRAADVEALVEWMGSE